MKQAILSSLGTELESLWTCQKAFPLLSTGDAVVAGEGAEGYKVGELDVFSHERLQDTSVGLKVLEL